MYLELKTTFIVFLLFTTTFCDAKAQNMMIQKHDGSLHTEQISMIQNLHYATSDLVVQLTDGSANAFALSDLKKIYFDTSIGFFEKEIPELSLAPNPATNILELKRPNEKASFLKIYNINGTLVYQQYILNALVTVDLSTFKPGLYFVSIDGVTTKFLKQ